MTRGLPTSSNPSSTYPSARINPGTWHDEAGNLWIFGGQQAWSNVHKENKNSSRFLQDLWVYSSDDSNPKTETTSTSFDISNSYSWKRLFWPEGDLDSSATSHPKSIQFPLLCGSETGDMVGIFGGRKINPRFSVQNHSFLHSQENIVWTYHISNTPAPAKVWNASEHPEARGSNETSSSSSATKLRKVTTTIAPEKKSGLWSSHACLPDLTNKFQSCPKFSVHLMSWCYKNSLHMLLPSLRNSKEDKVKMNWWKFDLIATKWITMPELHTEPKFADLFRNENCRVVSTTIMVYIVCPTKGKLLSRDILLFYPKKASIQYLGSIHLNNAFNDTKLWLPRRSVFHAIQRDNKTIIFLAYHKLLDMWIHDHSSNNLYPVENVWKGSSLRAFQRVTSFYKITISLKIPSLSFPPSKNITTEELITTDTFFMLNPRSKLAHFEVSSPSAHFHITVVKDREVFLPVRDVTDTLTSIQSLSLIYNTSGVSGESRNSSLKTDNPAKSGGVFLTRAIKADAAKHSTQMQAHGRNKDNTHVKSVAIAARPEKVESIGKQSKFQSIPCHRKYSSMQLFPASGKRSLPMALAPKLSGTRKVELLQLHQGSISTTRKMSDQSKRQITEDIDNSTTFSSSESNEHSQSPQSTNRVMNNDAIQEDMSSPLQSMTFGSSEIVVDHSNDIVSLGEEGNFTGEADYGPAIFFGSTLTFFASIGVVLFVRRCVKCPPSRESVLLKETPPHHFSLVPDDIFYHTHTPLVWFISRSLINKLCYSRQKYGGGRASDIITYFWSDTQMSPTSLLLRHTLWAEGAK